jgi:antitoxin (DNA-binding transcriptional repressor) of toxin-antitoxin stability system
MRNPFLVDKKENLMNELNESMTTISEQDLHDNFDDYLKRVQNGETFAIVSNGKILCYLEPHVSKNKEKTVTPKEVKGKGKPLPFAMQARKRM